jgi:hypothetical protein
MKMAVWIDKNKSSSYDECLMVMNIGQESITKVPVEYLETLRELLNKAHAAGHLVLYVFDNENGAMPIPDEFDDIEGLDFVRMMFDVCGRNDAKFSLDLNKRNKEFKAMADALISHAVFGQQIIGKITLCGQCYIDFEKVFIPAIDIG